MADRVDGDGNRPESKARQCWNGDARAATGRQERHRIHSQGSSSSAGVAVDSGAVSAAGVRVPAESPEVCSGVSDVSWDSVTFHAPPLRPRVPRP